MKDKEGAGEQNQTVWLIDWANPQANDFAIADEVTVKGEYCKRPIWCCTLTALRWA